MPIKEYLYDNWLTLASVIIAGIALCRTWIIDRKYDLRIKKREVDSYEKADLRAEIIKETHRGDDSSLLTRGYYHLYRISIQNIGECPAKNIRVESEIFSHERVHSVDTSILPYEILNKHDNFNIYFQPNRLASPKFKAKLIWDDEFGMNREKEFILVIL